jgi:predicted dehydrogenase
MKSSPLLPRREFLKTSALAASGLVFLPSLLTSCNTPTSRRVRRPGAADRINLGVIGFGTQAHACVPTFLGDTRLQVVAVADPVSELGNYGYRGELRGGRLVGQRIVEAHYAEWKDSGTFKGCRVYEDFREMLDREDLDAVYISTPDHWHCPAALHAIRRGLHVYGQKPLTLTVDEGRRMARAVAEAGVTFQTGSQQRSSVHFRTACEFVRNGRIGRVRHVKIGFNGGHTNWSGLASRNQPEPAPAELNYDLWLGPAPERPYVPALLQLNWRHNWDYSGGFVTDWGAHHLDILQWALGEDAGGPVRIENVKATLPPPTAVYNTPTAFSFDVVYANGVRANVSNAHRNGLHFTGENGREIFVARDVLEMTPRDLVRQKIEPGEIRLPVSTLHEKDFVDRIYDGGTPIAPVEVGHRSITIAHLANIAIRLGRDQLQWDPATERIIGDPEASAMLSRPSRKGFAV